MRKYCIISLAVLLCFSFCVASCGVTDVFDDIVEDTVSDSMSESSATSDISDVEVRYSDKSIAVPVFNSEFGFSMPLVAGTTCTMDGTCISTDGGVITYQWYVNNINSNSGGTVIDDATEAKYSAVTDEPGYQYFYVVASNNHGDRYNTATSDTVEIITYNNGEWAADEKGTKYVSEDGSFLSDIWIWIGEDIYHFDPEGYRTVGWLQFDKLYYFDEEGRLLRNGTTPDGCTTDESGCLVSGTPVITEPPAPPEGENPPAEEQAVPSEGEAPPAEGEAAPEAPAETAPEG